LAPAGYEVITREEARRAVSITTSYPQFTGPRTESKEALNLLIESAFLERYWADRDDEFPRMEERIREVDAGGPPLGMTEITFSQYSHEVALWSDELVSLHVKNYTSGGAHNNWTFFAVNYWWNGERVEEIQLEDLFAPEVNWQEELAPVLRQALARTKIKNHLWGPERDLEYHLNYNSPDGAQPTTDEELLKAPFTINKIGIVFHYCPYTVDCFAAGDFHVLVPFVQFERMLAHEGLRALWRL